jgi:hypothetical protein
VEVVVVLPLHQLLLPVVVVLLQLSPRKKRGSLIKKGVMM